MVAAGKRDWTHSGIHGLALKIAICKERQKRKKPGTNREKIMMMETMIQTPKQNSHGKRGLMSSIAFRVQTISLQIWSVYDLVNGRERKRGENPTGQIDCILSGLTGPVIRRSRGVHVRQRLIHKYDTTITL